MQKIIAKAGAAEMKVRMPMSWQKAKERIDKCNRMIEITHLSQLSLGMDLAKADEFISTCMMERRDVAKAAEKAWRTKMVYGNYAEAEAIATHFKLNSRESEAKRIKKRIDRIKKDIAEDTAMFI